MKKTKNFTQKKGGLGGLLSICTIGLLLNSTIHAIGVNAIFHSTVFDILNTTGNVFTTFSLIIIALDDITNEIIIQLNRNHNHTNEKIIDIINEKIKKKLENEDFKQNFIENVNTTDDNKHYLQNEWNHIVNFITNPDSKILGLQTFSALGINISGILFGVQTAMSEKINNIINYTNNNKTTIDLTGFKGIQRVAYIKDKKTGLILLSNKIIKIIKSEIENIEKRIHKKLFENHNENDEDTKCIIEDTVKEQMNILSIQISTRIFTIFENMNANIHKQNTYNEFVKNFKSEIQKEFNIIFDEFYPTK